MVDESLLDLLLYGAMDTFVSDVLFPFQEKLILGYEAFKRASLERIVLSDYPKTPALLNV